MKLICYGIDFPHEKGTFCEREAFPHYLIACFSTPFLYEKNGKLLRGNPGELIIMSPGVEIYHGPQKSNESFVNDWFQVVGEDFEDLIKKIELPENTSFSIGNPIFLKNQLKKIRDELLLKDTGYENIINCLITETIIELKRLYVRHNENNSSLTRITSARESFLRHPEKEWSLKKMADISGYSVSRFSSLYLEHFGKPPKAELIASRIELAKQLLTYSKLSVTEISSRCGFKSIYYFSKYFKQAVGCTASEYTEKKVKAY